MYDASDYLCLGVLGVPLTDLMVLPPFEDGIADKLMLIKAHMNSVVQGIDNSEKRRQMWATLTSELPAFLSFLESWEIPTELKADRFGIKTYHHPELLAKMRELQPEQRLMALIDDCVFRYHNKYSWDGPAIALERILTDDKYSLHHEARQLLRGANSCGTYLGRLAKYPETRVVGRTIQGQTKWSISKPTQEGHPSV